jgi:hypothetical protein
MAVVPIERQIAVVQAVADEVLAQMAQVVLEQPVKVLTVAALAAVLVVETKQETVVAEQVRNLLT